MEAIQQIEEILGIKLEDKQYGELYNPEQKNTYSIRKEEIESLRLDDVIIEDFSKLFSYLKKLRYLRINNSTIPNFSELLNLTCHDLLLDNVVFKNNKCGTKGKIPTHFMFSNMKFDAACLKCFKLGNIGTWNEVMFKNCHIDNIQHIDDIEPIYHLIFDKITFTYKPKKTSKKSTRRLTISNSNFKDVDFLPFKDSLEDVIFENCQIGSIAGLTEFPKLKKISIDSDTTIEDKVVVENIFDKKIICSLNQAKQPLDLRMITSIKKYINTLELHNYKEKKIDFIEEFESIKNLSFGDSKVYIDAFLPIAKQIETICFANSIIKKHKYFKYFKNLTNFQTTKYDENNNGLKTLEKIFPLKNQLKILDIYEGRKIKASHLIKEFKALESLKIDCKIPVETVKHILRLKNLKKLSLDVNIKKCTLNLKHLKELEFLILDTKCKFKGFEHLKKLKSLKVEENYSSKRTIDINSFPKMESLKRLNLTNYDYKIKGLDQFPNLEALRLKGTPKIRLGKLENLKVLDLDNSSFVDFSRFEELPSLEKLDLSSHCTEMNLEGFYKFPNLKYLTFMETELSDISYLEPLKKLEYLDLFATDVPDIKVLNTLPNLKGVNLAGNANVNSKDLDKPEIAVYYGFIPIYFGIWEKDEFGI